MSRTIRLLNRIGFVLPFLVGILLVVSKFSENSNRLPWGQLNEALLFSLIISAGSLGVFYAIPLTRKSSGIISAAFVLVTMLWMLFPVVLVPVGLLLVVIVVFTRLEGNVVRLISGLAVFVIGIACLVALIMAGVNTYRPIAQAANPSIVLKETPDIYFIVPDRFCNHQGLLEIGYDDSEFMEYLGNAGFYVNENALSQDAIQPTDRGVATTRTGRFMASVLNLGVEIDLNIPYNVASQMVKYNEFTRILKANGYSYYHIGDWWSETETNPLADINYVYRGASLMPDEELSMALLDRSIWRYLDTYLWRSDEAHRQRNLYQLESFKDAVNKLGPKFVFVHTLLPHPPFVWTANGRPQEDAMLTVWEQYIEQTKFTETFLKQCVEAVSEEDILIIQADEGICFTKPQLNLNLTENQWNGVLSAWRIPGDLSEVEPTQILSYVIDYLKEG